MNNVQQIIPVAKCTRDAEAKKKQILSVFSTLVREKDYTSTTMRDIAEAAARA